MIVQAAERWVTWWINKAIVQLFHRNYSSCIFIVAGCITGWVLFACWVNDILCSCDQDLGKKVSLKTKNYCLWKSFPQGRHPIPHLLPTALETIATSLALACLIYMQHLHPSVFALSSHRKLNVATDAICQFIRARELNVLKLQAGNLWSWPNLWSSRLHKINSRASRKRLIRYKYFFIIDKYFTFYC